MANSPSTAWSPVPEARSYAAEVSHDDRRFVVVFSPVRYLRDRARHLSLCSKVEDGLIAIEARVRAKRLVDPAAIGAAADRVLRDSGVARCFTTTVAKGQFSWDFNEKARRYDEELLCGRYVITTSLKDTDADAAQVLRYYRSLLNVECWLSQKFLPAVEAFPDLSFLVSAPLGLVPCWPSWRLRTPSTLMSLARRTTLRFALGGQHKLAGAGSSSPSRRTGRATSEAAPTRAGSGSSCSLRHVGR